MTHPQRVHNFPDDYEFYPKKDVYVRRHYGKRTVDLVSRKHGRAALVIGNKTWVYNGVGDALKALTGWTGKGSPPNGIQDSELLAS
jgi:hypothetical protein